MKLTNLEPRWFTFAHPADGVDICIGLTFLCPHCMTQRIGVRFTPPLDPKGQLPQFGIAWVGEGPLWKREGDTFDTLTLSPSINVGSDQIDVPGHWHGFVRNGEVT